MTSAEERSRHVIEMCDQPRDLLRRRCRADEHHVVERSEQRAAIDEHQVDEALQFMVHRCARLAGIGGRLGRADEFDTAPTPDDVIELRGLLYGLYAVLKLHNSQEEEGAFSLITSR